MDCQVAKNETSPRLPHVKRARTSGRESAPGTDGGDLPPSGEHGPIRSCVGCGQRAVREELIRCILTPDGGIAADLKGGSFGRGAWLHPRPQCLQSAVKKGFARSFRSKVDVTTVDLCRVIAEAAERRLFGLLQAARARRSLIFGRDSVQKQLHQVKVGLLATDAPSLTNEGFIRELGSAGRLIVWGNKGTFGAWLGRADVAILAVTEDGLAERVAQTVALARLTPELAPGEGSAERKILSEVR
jgi:hypothetical protein